MVKAVVTKFTPLKVEDAPSRTIPAMNAVAPAFGPFSPIPARLEYGGYITQVISADSPLNMPVKSRGAAATSNHKPSALIRGNARSFAPI